MAKQYKPDASTYNPDAEYLREIVNTAQEKLDISQSEVARRIGILPRSLRANLTGSTNHRQHPYSVQYAIEMLGF